MVPTSQQAPITTEIHGEGSLHEPEDIQCCTGHAHTGKYYKQFVSTLTSAQTPEATEHQSGMQESH